MRLIASFAFLMCLIVFIAPSLGQQTATDWLNKGQRLVDQGRYNEALQAYDEGIKLDPVWTDLYYHKGTAYNKLDMVDEAVEAFDMVNQINPMDGVVAYYWIGRTLSGAGRYEEAIRAYEASTQSFNTYGEWFSGQKSICAQAWYYEGLALDAVGRSDEAQNAYNNAILLDPSLTRPVTGPRTPGTGTGTGIGTGIGTVGDVTQYCLLRKPYYPPQENCFEFYLAATTASAARATAAGGVCSCTDIGVREGWEPDELYPGPFSTFSEGDAAMQKVSPYFDDAYGCHAEGGDTTGTGNEQSIDASPGYNDLASTNPIRGFVDSDQVDVWVPFSFDFSVTTNVDKAKIVMVVKPIGQLIGTDSLILKGASGEGREVYSEFDALKANQWNTVEVDVSGNSDVMDAIKTGHLEGLIQDDSAVQSVKLVIGGTTIPHPSLGSIV
jgi:tetratricopeptide (TPR) repeat protein